ncbi:MAG: porin family protein [Treponema sp.]|jgi:opacity protein-like surface antigen|nr:porin family protein [Treponema sp.]
MVKKCLFVLALAVLSVGVAFAQMPFALSAGFGGFIGGDFGGGIDIDNDYTVLQSTKTAIDTPYFGGGGYAFFDAKYAELTLGIYGGRGKLRMKQEAKTGPAFSIQQEADISIVNFNIGLSLKYPFGITKNFSAYPLAGIDYHIALLVKDGDGNEYTNPEGKERSGDFSALCFNFGGGADYLLTDKMYLRFEALYSIRLLTRFENDLYKYFGEVISSVPGPDDGSMSYQLHYGHGLMARLALGFKF